MTKKEIDLMNCQVFYINIEIFLCKIMLNFICGNSGKTSLLIGGIFRSLWCVEPSD
jgi:hypothetical protein